MASGRVVATIAWAFLLLGAAPAGDCGKEMQGYAPQAEVTLCPIPPLLATTPDRKGGQASLYFVAASGGRNIVVKIPHGDATVRPNGAPPSPQTPENRQRLLKMRADALRAEAEILQKLPEAEHVVKLLVVGEETIEGQKVPVLGLERVPGETVFDRLQRKDGGPKAEEILRILDDVAAGIEEIQAAGYVHGDISAPNILLRPDGRSIVIDLGLARKMGEPMGKGTPGYASPEQFNPVTRSTPAFDTAALRNLAYKLLKVRGERIVLRTQSGAEIRYPGRSAHTVDPKVSPVLSLLAWHYCETPAASRRLIAEAKKALAPGGSPDAFFRYFGEKELGPLIERDPRRAALLIASAKELSDRYPAALGLTAEQRLKVASVAAQRGVASGSEAGSLYGGYDRDFLKGMAGLK